ncbi:hypothetical protein U9M48_000432 [Paspalum notatum var. saurae]|uniref:Uncharacterized protein n=1 Tax=Paspalum notatum var. saurae TaxID=547442 RepID=A0AAQ3SEK0_PASNO
MALDRIGALAPPLPTAEVDVFLLDEPPCGEYRRRAHSTELSSSLRQVSVSKCWPHLLGFTAS